MSSFSASEAAFEGFRVIGRHPAAILVWTLGYTLIQMIVLAVVYALFGPQLASLAPYSGAGAVMPPEVLQRFFATLLSMMVVILPLSLVSGSVLINANFRAVLRPEDKGAFYLRLGGDEWRIIQLQLAWFGVILLAYLALAVVIVILAVVLALATGGAGGAAAAMTAVAAIAAIALVCAVIWLAVRFSLAGPMTFAEKQVRVFGSWGVTKGRFWPLFGCYLLAMIFAVMIVLVGGGIALAIAGVLFGPSTFAVTNPTDQAAGLRAMAQMFTPGSVARTLMGSVYGAIANVILISALAAAYRDLTHRQTDAIWG